MKPLAVIREMRLFEAKYLGDDKKSKEWEGGCEDPRCVETEDGTYVIFYTQYRRGAGGWRTGLGIATSKDLLHWTKHGTVTGMAENGDVVAPPKSASLVTAVKNGRLIATKIDGKYWLYYGAGTIRLMTSPDLKTWAPVSGFAVEPRPGRFDSGLVECGPPAVATAGGIALLYNGMNARPPNGDASLPPGVYSGGQLVFDPKNPARLIARSDAPFIKPELPWEKTGQYVSGTTFIEGLVLFNGKWFLYYGAADSFVGVAVSNRKPIPAAAAVHEMSLQSRHMTPSKSGRGGPHSPGYALSIRQRSESGGGGSNPVGWK